MGEVGAVGGEGGDARHALAEIEARLLGIGMGEVEARVMVDTTGHGYFVQRQSRERRDIPGEVFEMATPIRN